LTKTKSYEDIIVSLDKNVGLIEINRPPYNFFDHSLIRQIADALERFDDVEPCRAIVLFSKGKAFCAGAQFSEDPEGKANYSLGSPAPLYDEAVRIFQTKKPIIAAIHGAAVGGGLGLALTADFRIGCSESRFVANFTKLGFHPGFGLTVTLPELVGKNNAEFMFYTSRRIKGEVAFQMGLLNELVPKSNVFQASINLASEIAECSPLGLLSTRATVRGDLADRIRRATERELKEQTWLRDTADFAEGVKAVSERRPAHFSSK
jgi:enoyl-CoA hydratase/carnithine racemase